MPDPHVLGTHNRKVSLLSRLCVGIERAIPAIHEKLASRETCDNEEKTDEIPRCPKLVWNRVALATTPHTPHNMTPYHVALSRIGDTVVRFASHDGDSQYTTRIGA